MPHIPVIHFIISTLERHTYASGGMHGGGHDAIFVLAKPWMQFKCPPIRAWLNGLGDTHSLEGLATARGRKVDFYAPAITDLQDALFCAKGKFQSDVYAGSHSYLKTIYTKHIYTYVQPHCVFSKGTGVCMCVHTAR